jgi:hypothetical protein
MVIKVINNNTNTNAKPLEIQGFLSEGRRIRTFDRLLRRHIHIIVKYYKSILYKYKAKNKYAFYYLFYVQNREISHPNCLVGIITYEITFPFVLK